MTLGEGREAKIIVKLVCRHPLSTYSLQLLQVSCIIAVATLMYKPRLHLAALAA
ncbi:hypothetical protein K466DRAFT_585768 [Polyporus arcularius HHB13444]|uniref:Uncharacterized protein n=1 Tax=Polyporus arcularius HHB13444 TaxID=1314778 RepID=A0A5C3PEZ1_9APHY|nr:hypothetical protein K466DRAFT_585768 [Polyporus arcularius HHB13444]